MGNKNEPAFPIVETKNVDNISFGLSKREYIAALTLQGILSNAHYINYTSAHVELMSCDKIVAQAVLFTDELLKQLEAQPAP